MKEKYFKFKEIVLYLFGLSCFINFKVAKGFIVAMIILLIIDRFYFKEKLECGSEKLKKFLLIFIIGGTIWNFLARFDYRAARNFFRLNEYLVVIFYLYPLVKRDKKVLRNFIISLILSFIPCIWRGIMGLHKINLTAWLRKGYRLSGVVGTTNHNTIFETAVLSMLFATFSFGQFFDKNNKYSKIISVVLFPLSLLILLMTQTKSGFVGFIIGAIAVIFMTADIKKIVGAIVITTLGIFLIYNSSNFQSTRTYWWIQQTFVKHNLEANIARKVMIENAIWRIKQHPIMGSGTKRDDKLFKEYVKNMPENTPQQKEIKGYFKSGYNDAHNMYLNGISDNGIFYIFNLTLMFLIMPYILIKNKNYIYRYACMGGLVSYYVFGLFWPTWRHGWDPLFFYIVVSIGICSTIWKEDN